MPLDNVRYRWLHARLWLWLLLYWLVTMMGAGVIARAGVTQNYEAIWVLFIMLVFVSVCMITDRGPWKPLYRIGFVLLAWITQAALTIPALFTFGLLVHSGGRPDLLERVTVFFASLPLLLIAMRRSKLFVKADKLVV